MEIIQWPIWLLFGLVMILIGTCIGIRAEREAWTTRAITKENWGRCAHHCDGKFFYIIEESVFVHEYVRVPLAEEVTDAKDATKQD